MPTDFFLYQQVRTVIEAAGATGINSDELQAAFADTNWKALRTVICYLKARHDMPLVSIPEGKRTRYWASPDLVGEGRIVVGNRGEQLHERILKKLEAAGSKGLHLPGHTSSESKALNKLRAAGLCFSGRLVGHPVPMWLHWRNEADRDAEIAKQIRPEPMAKEPAKAQKAGPKPKPAKQAKPPKVIKPGWSKPVGAEVVVRRKPQPKQEVREVIIPAGLKVQTLAGYRDERFTAKNAPSIFGPIGTYQPGGWTERAYA